jgi:endonuclease YncB( thermonuclease family)
VVQDLQPARNELAKQDEAPSAQKTSGEPASETGSNEPPFEDDIINTPPLYGKGVNKRSAYKVLWVSSGDSVVLRIDGETVPVRLAGVAAPDIGIPLGTREYFALEALRYLKELVLGEEVVIESESHWGVDPKKRKQAYIFRLADGLFVNFELVRLGYCKAQDKTDFDYRHFEVFQTAQEEVKHYRKGVWSYAGQDGRTSLIDRDGSGVLAGAGVTLSNRREYKDKLRSNSGSFAYQGRASAIAKALSSSPPSYFSFNTGVSEIPRDNSGKTVHVQGHSRKDGTYVRGHWRRPPSR